MLKEGDKAPIDVVLKDSEGNDVSLKSLSGKKAVIYFYPKDDTPGCTKEACAFRDDADSFRLKGVEVIGISGDTGKSHQKFINKYNLNFPLWSDEENKLGIAFGAYGEKSMYGRKYMGYFRYTFVIDENGLILKVYDKVKPETHSQEILADMDSYN